jgi:AcrR family transcriptional regulator
MLSRDAVPRTRSEIDREAKIAEIVEAAARRLRQEGFDGLSVAAIARELGLAQNAIYWYFPSRDHLFVAALEWILGDIASRKPKGSDVGTRERILWFTDQFESLSDLLAAMNERAKHAAVVAEFVRELDTTRTRMLRNALRDRVPERDLELAVASFRATVEGTFVKGLSRRERHEVLGFALDRLIGPAR